MEGKVSRLRKPKHVRRLDFDLIRAASMAAVVYLHTAAGGLRQSEDMALWHLSNLLSSLAVAAVPLFFMISGALLLGSDRDERRVRCGNPVTLPDVPDGT